MIHSLLPTALPVSTLNTIHHSRPTVCLSDSLDLNPLSISSVYSLLNTCE